MIAKLIFKLPEDQDDYDGCMNGAKLEYVIHEFWEVYIRQMWKYEDKTTIKIDEIRDEWYRLCREYDVKC